jgi:hypothetical protein
MILYIPEGHGCAYSIDAEGELFYTPILEGGTLCLEETDIVDYYDAVDNECESEINEIQDKLIEMNKTAGFYFTK